MKTPEESNAGTPMTGDEQYLWDGTGAPSHATRQIEGALRVVRFSGSLKVDQRVGTARGRVPQRRVSGKLFAVAAGLLMAVTVGYLVAPRRQAAPMQVVTPAAETWTITKRVGEVLVSESLPMKSTITKRVVSTGANAGATVRAGAGTVVDIEPSTVVEFADGNARSPWMALTSGSIFAQVGREDRPVMLGIPGESMTLRPGAAASVVANQKAGTQLTCKTGEVYFDWGQKQTRVHGPATCSVNPESGPALPYPGAASKEACSSIDSVDHLLKTTASASPVMMYGELHDYLRTTTAADATTLWNLLWRVPEEWRAPVRDRLAKVIRQPKGDPQLVLKLDPMTMDAWWNAAVEAAERR